MTTPVQAQADSARPALARRVAQASGFAGPAGAGPPLSPEEVRFAVSEGLGSLLGYRLRAAAALVERDEDRVLLSRQYRAGIAQEIAQGAALAEVGDLFARLELPFLRLKAAALRGTVLPEGTRPASDIDLLVPRRRFEAAIDILRRAGFTLRGDSRRALTVSRYHERNLERGGLILDLHRDLAAWPLFPIAYDDLSTGALPAPGGGRVPEPARLLVSLAAHATQHGFAVPFRSIVDALAVIRTLGPEPGRVVETARRWRVTRGTSLLLSWLDRLGLEAADWQRAAQELAGNWPVGRFVDQLPLAGPPDSVAGRRRERGWRARLSDRRWRTLAFYGYRGALWAGDVTLRALPARLREGLQEIGSERPTTSPPPRA